MELFKCTGDPKLNELVISTNPDLFITFWYTCQLRIQKQRTSFIWRKGQCFEVKLCCKFFTSRKSNWKTWIFAFQKSVLINSWDISLGSVVSETCRNALNPKKDQERWLLKAAIGILSFLATYRVSGFTTVQMPATDLHKQILDVSALLAYSV